MGIVVEYTSSYTTQKALNFMYQFQTMYGLGQADAAVKGQFGLCAKLDGSLVPMFDGTMQPLYCS